MPSEKTVSKASEARRSTKPIMEKRRRARINSSLAELKNLILDALKKDNARHSKLEKADILEMTVKHLQNLQMQQMAAAVSTDPVVMTKFRSGFSECANEVSRFLSRVDGVDPAVRQRLLNHLGSCLSGLSMPSSPPAAYSTLPVPSMGPMQPVHIQVPSNATSNCNPTANMDNEMGNRIFGGLQLVPTRLPTGEIAFLLPSQPTNNNILSVYAPTTVPISPAATSTSPSDLSSTSNSISSPSPVNVLGSSGILSPAASDCSSISPSPVSPISLVRHSHEPQYPIALVAVKQESERVWRPW